MLIEVRADGSKELVALKDGYRESGESWADLLRDCARRGMRAPVFAVGDGALGFWRALAEVFPETREQRCWVHKTANVLDSMPKVRAAGREEGPAGNLQRRGPRLGRGDDQDVRPAYGAKLPKAVKKITADRDQLLAFYGFPAEHWIHLRVPRTPLSRPSPPSGCGPRSPAAPAPAPPPWPCSSNSSSPPSSGGGP
ncbi:transposase [Streptomyces sp. NPDC007251]|uniref:transposase n=1 Tax=Streptomyces sp. NPDC007251 TaxID=3154483 RepID=UPI0033C660DE